MANWRKIFLLLANDAEREFDRRITRLKDRLGWLNPLLIQPYRGYGTPQQVRLRGRVLEDHGVKSAQETDSVWDNLLNMYRRFDSNEIGGARVRLRFGGVMQDALTDNDGFFTFAFTPDPALLRPDRHWYEAELELIDPLGPEHDSRVQAAFMIPPPGARFGIISDIDDTVVKTDAFNLLKMARNTFLHNAHTRLPFNGVAAFYTALVGGVNPMFYLSSGYWNLYDLLCDFFQIRGIPPGSLFLTDMGLTPDYVFLPGHRQHKLGAVDDLLTFYPDLPFILIGDSGQKDPEIYLEAALKYPGRIPAIYIRDVSRDKRDTAIEAMIEQAAAVGTTMLRVADTVEAAVHAVQHGFIEAAALEGIRKESENDQNPPNPIEALLDEETLV